MAPVTRLVRCPLHGASRANPCRECAEKPIYELAREVLAHPSTVFLVEPVRRILEAVAQTGIVYAHEVDA